MGDGELSVMTSGTTLMLLSFANSLATLQMVITNINYCILFSGKSLEQNRRVVGCCD